MNVLPIVFSILMLLAIMTYSQLQTFLLRGTVRAEYICYIKNRSRNHLNLLQEELYDENKTKGQKRKEISEQALGSSKIDINWFIEGADNGRFQQAHYDIIRSLFDIIYADRKFYREAEEKRPDIVNELWGAVIEKVIDMRAEGETLSNVDHLANLQLDDPELEEFLAQILKRVETPNSVLEKCGTKEVKDSQKTVEYYPNLIDFLTLKPRPQAYRVLLIERPLLLAIFRDEDVVNDIIVKRKEFYNDLRKAPKDQREAAREDLSIRFETHFKTLIPQDIPIELLNFQVSLSSPPN